MRDALGNETEYSYDVCDRLIEIRQNGDEIQENNTKLNEEIQKARELNNKGKVFKTIPSERREEYQILPI